MSESKARFRTGRIELTNNYVRNYVISGVCLVIGAVALIIALIPRKISE